MDGAKTFNTMSLQSIINWFKPHKWVKIDRAVFTNEQWRMYKENEVTGSRIRVKKIILLERCENTGKERGRVLYGAGSYYDDCIITAERAKLMIKGDL